MGSRYSQPQAGFVEIITVDQRFQIPFSETDTCIALDSLVELPQEYWREKT